MRSSWIAFLAATTLATWAPAMAQDHSSIQTVLQAKTGVWTYPGTGTVNTYWIETPGGGLVIIDVQRDLVHAAQALAAVKAVGKPVRAILVTHAHPDHYTGLGLFRRAFPGVPVYSSKATADAIRNDTYGANAGEQADAPDITPRDFVAPGITFDLSGPSAYAELRGVFAAIDANLMRSPKLHCVSLDRSSGGHKGLQMNTRFGGLDALYLAHPLEYLGEFR
jgi:glyoxylase-like metal-dependent hydrolase (beta-lactamase superfamily II)